MAENPVGPILDLLKGSPWERTQPQPDPEDPFAIAWRPRRPMGDVENPGWLDGVRYRNGSGVFRREFLIVYVPVEGNPLLTTYTNSHDTWWDFRCLVGHMDDRPTIFGGRKQILVSGAHGTNGEWRDV